jgi:hypothetical protein
MLRSKTQTTNQKMTNNHYTTFIRTIVYYGYCVLFAALPIHLVAQEQLGVRLDTYMGLQTSFLNPANTASFPLRWNLNLAGASLFIDNSYLYLDKTNMLHSLANIEQIKPITDFKNSTPTADDIVLNFYRGNRNSYGITDIKVNGPSVLFRVKQHSFGAFYNLRYMSEATNVPSELNYDKYERLPYRKIIDMPPLSGRMMFWDEFGANYAFQWETNSGKAQIGINAKILRGYEGAYAGSWSKTEFARYPKDTVYVGVPDFSFGITTGNIDNIANQSYDLQRQGLGLGFDIGANWYLAEYEDTYEWKFGASLMDIGKINFSPTAELHYINKITPTNLVTSNDFDGVKTPTQWLRRLSAITMGDSLKSLRANKFAIAMPMALHLAAEYQFYPHAFATFILQQRIKQQDAPLHRGNLVALVARYERRWFSATLPLSLYNYRHFRTGVAMRLGYLTLGTENLGSWLVKKKLTGTDFYFALVFNPFNLNWMFPSKDKAFSKRVKCYQF